MISIKVPPLGESIVEATISRWTKQEGESVASGETLVELETDKVTVEVPAPRAGVLTRRIKSEGDVVQVGEGLGELDETAAGHAAPAPSATIATTPAVTPAATTPAAPPAASVPAVESAVRASPAAQRVALESGIDLAAVSGSGRGGVISKPDVIEQASKPAPVPATPAPSPAAAAAAPPPTPVPAKSNGARETREKMSTRRKRIAKHLLESQHATAHLTTFNEVDMSAVESLRGRIRERIEKEHGVKLSMMPFFVRAACLALKQYPVVNAKIDGDHVIYHHYVNMGIAVASEAGLVVPNVKDADRLGMIDVGRAISEVA
ncbi:MAG: 2-oxo acid dehydrogenase subunit E2, partial [Gemmatimonadaceae bacterium]